MNLKELEAGLIAIKKNPGKPHTKVVSPEEYEEELKKFDEWKEGRKDG